MFKRCVASITFALLTAATVTAIAGCRAVMPSGSAPVHSNSPVAPPVTTPTGSAGNAMASSPIYVTDIVSDAPRFPGTPWPIKPLLDFVNDTDDTMVLRRLDDPSIPDIILAPGARFVTSWGGQFFGGPSMPEYRRDELRQGSGISVAIQDKTGYRRGRILFTSSYLFGGVSRFICLSGATEPPWIVDSWHDLDAYPCRW